MGAGVGGWEFYPYKKGESRTSVSHVDEGHKNISGSFDASHLKFWPY